MLIDKTRKDPIRYTDDMDKDEITTTEESTALARVFTTLQSGKIRELTDITDLCAEAMSAIVKKEMPTAVARELRQWAELMYTCVQAQRISGEGSGVNFVTQLIQMNGGTVSTEETPRQQVEEIFDIKEVI